MTIKRPTKQLERRFWNLHSRTWDDLLVDPTAARHIDDLVDWIQAEHPHPGNVIDLGCGTGNYVLRLAADGCAVIGLDYAPGMLAQADRKRRSERLRAAAFVAADLHHGLPLRSGSVDVTLSIYSLQLLDLGHVLAEAQRLLTAGGTLLLEVPKSAAIPRRAPGANALSHRMFHHIKRQLARLGARTRIVQLYSEHELRGAVAAADFSVIGSREDARRLALLCRKPTASAVNSA